MLIDQLLRVIKGPSGGFIASLFGPKLLMIAGIGVLGVYAWGKFNAVERDAAVAQAQVVQVENVQLTQAIAQLNRAVNSLEQYNADRMVRTQVSQQATEVISRDDTDTLDMPIPDDVLSVLRNAAATIGSLDTSGAAVGADSPDGGAVVSQGKADLP